MPAALHRENIAPQGQRTALHFGHEWCVLKREGSLHPHQQHNQAVCMGTWSCSPPLADRLSSRGRDLLLTNQILLGHHHCCLAHRGPASLLGPCPLFPHYPTVTVFNTGHLSFLCSQPRWLPMTCQVQPQPSHLVLQVC